jgi:O-antigen/teichoic acid export membrane protein
MALNKPLFWTLGTMGVMSALKLGGNVTLGHILTPHDFGLAAIVFAVIFGLEMMTDGGAIMSLIRSKRTDNAWLDTVWSFQIVRSLLICALAMIAAKPLSNFFQEPELFGLLLLIGILPVCDAFVSTSANMALRDLKLKQYSILEIGSLIISYCVTIPVAYYYQTAWALVLGGVVNTAAHAVFSFVLFPYRPHRFRFEREALRELFGFGIWLTITSAIGFLLFQGDKLIVGKALGTVALGLYSIAVTWSMAFADAAMRLVMRVFVPAFASVYRADGHTRRIAQIRRQVLIAIMVPFAVIAALGQQIIEFIYPPIMTESGPLLQILMIGVWFSMLDMLYNNQFLVEGKSDRRLYAQIMSIIALALMIYFDWGNLTTLHLCAIFVAGTAVRALTMCTMAYANEPSAAVPDILLTVVFLVLVVTFSASTVWLSQYAGTFVVMLTTGLVTALPALGLGWYAWKKSNQWFVQEAA